MWTQRYICTIVKVLMGEQGEQGTDVFTSLLHFNIVLEVLANEERQEGNKNYLLGRKK